MVISKDKTDLNLGILDPLQTLCSVVARVLPLLVSHDPSPQLSSLVIVVLLSFVPVMACSANNVVVDLIRSLRNVWSELVSEAVRCVLLIPSMICINSHWAVKGERRIGFGHEWTVDGDLVEVDSNAMVLCIAVEEHAELEKGIRRVFDTRNHAAGRESRLLDVSVEVLGVLIKNEATKLLHGELISGPNLGDVEGIEAEFIGVSLLRLHDLNLGRPFDLLATLNGFPEISFGVVRILTTHLNGFLVCELLLTVLCDEVILDVDEFTVLVDPFESVTAVAVVKAPTNGSSVITEEHEAGVVSLGSVGE